MPTYSMKAPNGQTYQISGPAGATDDQVREQILAQHPDAGNAPSQPAVVMRRPGTPAPQQQAQPAAQPEDKPYQPTGWLDMAANFAKNLVPSTVKGLASLSADALQLAGKAIAHPIDNVVAPVAHAAAHPVDDIVTPLTDVAAHTISAITPQAMHDSVKNFIIAHGGDPKVIADAINHGRQLDGPIGDHFRSRYGDEAAIQRTIANDPFSFLVDLGTVATGGEGLLARGAELARIAELGASSAAVRTGAGVVRDIAEAGARGAGAVAKASNPVALSAAELSAPANVIRKVAGDTGAAGKVAAAVDPMTYVRGAGKVVNKTLGGTGSLLTFQAGTDKASRVLKDSLTDQQLADVTKVLQDNPTMLPRDALAQAGVPAPVIQAIGDAIETGPGGQHFGPIRDAQKDAIAAEDASRVKANQDAVTAVKDGHVQELRDLGQQQLDQRRQMRDAHAAELQANAGADAATLDQLKQQHAQQLSALDDTHAQTFADTQAAHAAELEATQQGRAAEVQQLTDQAQATQDAMAGGPTDTAARKARDVAKQNLDAQTGPMRDEALAAANQGSTILDLQRQAEAARADAAARVERVRSMGAGAERQAGKADALGGATTDPALAKSMGLTDEVARRGDLAGRMDAQAGKAADESLAAGDQARTAESKIEELHANGVGILDTKRISDKLRSMADAPGTRGNTVQSTMLRKAADVLDRLTRSAPDGVLDARDLYEFRKAGINEVADRMFRGDPTASQRHLGTLLRDVRPAIDEAIVEAGGSGWKDYLAKYHEGMNAIDQREFAAIWRRMSDGEKIAVARGERPDLVENHFGRGSYDVAEQMSAAKGPGAENFFGRMGDVADTLERRNAVKEAGPAADREMKADHRAAEAQLKSDQQAEYAREERARAQALKEKTDELKTARGERKQQLEQQVRDLRDAQKDARDATRDRHAEALRKMVVDHEEQLQAWRKQANATSDTMAREARYGKYDAQKALEGSSNKANRAIRDIARFFLRAKGAAVTDVASVLTEASISKGMQKALLEAYKSGSNMEALLTRLKPSQRAAIKTGFIKRGLTGTTAQRVGNVQNYLNRQDNGAPQNAFAN